MSSGQKLSIWIGAQLGPVGAGGEKQTRSSNGTIHFLKVRNKACHQTQLPHQLEIFTFVLYAA